MADEVVGVEEVEQSFFFMEADGTNKHTLFEMTVYGHRVDHRVYAPTKEEALEEARMKFAQIIEVAMKVESQLRSMEYDEEEY